MTFTNGKLSVRRILAAVVCLTMCTIFLLHAQTLDMKLPVSTTNLSPTYNLTSDTVNASLLSKDDLLVAHPDNDETTLINLTNFQFTINHDPCKNSHPLILSLIHSAPKNHAKRMVIRETWGQKIYGITVLFFVGVTESQSELEEEDKTYGDIIQGNFIDSYRNLTYKHVMALKWTKYHCPNVKYVLKLDDDVFVNTPAMLGLLARNMLPWGENRMMLCSPASNREPQRESGLKWTVTQAEYHEKLYPAYCLGWVIIYKLDSIILLYKEAQRNPYFWIDDVHITGTIAKKVNLTYTSLDSQILRGKNLEDFIKSPKATVDFLLVGPQVNENNMRKLWKAVVSTLT